VRSTHHRCERGLANHCSKARDPDDKRAGSKQDENPAEPVKIPELTFTEYGDDGPVDGPYSHDESPSKDSMLAPGEASSTFNALHRQRSPSASGAPRISPVASVPPQQIEIPPGPLKRATELPTWDKEVPFLRRTLTNSSWAQREHSLTPKWKRPTQGASPNNLRILPSVTCHVPYEESQKNGKRTVDLVIVYMFHGDKNTGAHKKLFECPEPGRELNVRRGKVSASLAAAGQENEPQPVQSASPRPTEPVANRSTQDELEKTQNWLKDPLMLPEVLPYNRTICVGYDLDTVDDQNAIDYEGAAHELLEYLKKQRSACSTRPITFIGHGLGCYVVYQALLCGATNSVAKLLQDACAGILFHHVPVGDSGPDSSNPLAGMEKHSSNTTPVTDAHKSSSKPDRMNPVLDLSRLTEIAREHSILHHVLNHGPSEKDHVQSFNFSKKNDSLFQQLSAKIVEWSETHQLMRSVEQADFATVKQLLDEGVKINIRKTLSEETALHVACQQMSSKSQDIDMLVRTGKADVTLRDMNGRTPLHYALRHRSPDVEIVRVLLEAGADIYAPDCDRFTPWDHAKQTGRKKLRRLLRMRPLVEGPSATKGSVGHAQPHSRSAGEVCDTYQMAATEMYFDSQTLTEKHLPQHFSISDAIYGKKTLQAMLDVTRSDPINAIKNQLSCRWYHLPANNMVWVEDLFRNRFKMHPTIWSEQVRDSEWPHGRCIIPHSAQFNAESGESILAVCMPYVSYEDNQHQTSVSDTARKQVPSTQAKWLDGLSPILGLNKALDDAFEARDVVPQRPDTFRLSTPQEHRPITSSGPLSDASEFGRQSLEAPVHDPDTDSDVDASDGDTSRFITSKLSKEEKDLVRVYLHHSPPLHTRRTLDQYYYYMLEDTRKRDADQVVTRWARDRLRKPHHNILMVDQLWIWVIKGKDDQPDRVISCFPEREGHGSGFLDDLHRNVLHHNADKRQPIATTADLVARIVTTCSDIFSWSQEAELVRFLHFFEATVGRVGDDEIKLLNDFGENSEELHGLDDKHFKYADDKDDMLIKLLDARPQIKLLKEAKDIQDEINIILHVLREQLRVLEDEDKTIKSFFGPNKNDKTDVDGGNAWREPLRVVRRAVGDFDKMDKQMKKIVTDLNHLLDLQQKQATVWEARSTREGARATSRQGNVMVIFTMVTIVFLPLSFCASFFALNIGEFPTDDNGQTNWPLRRLSAYLFGISFAVIIPLIALAFTIESVILGFFFIDNKWLSPFTITFLNVLSWLPFLRKISSKAADRVAKRQKESYGAPKHVPRWKRRKEPYGASKHIPRSRMRSHSRAAGFGRGNDSSSSIESTCSGSSSHFESPESEPEQRRPMFSRWRKEKGERQGKPVDEDV
jgi:hypothetical protein